MIPENLGNRAVEEDMNNIFRLVVVFPTPGDDVHPYPSQVRRDRESIVLSRPKEGLDLEGAIDFLDPVKEERVGGSY